MSNIKKADYNYGDINLSHKQHKALKKMVADLRIQAMMFDMHIDYETLTLTPKNDYKEPIWLTKWKERIDASDSRLYDHEH